MSFTGDINNFINDFDEVTEEIMKVTAFSLFRDIIFASPVDTGRFRGNWFATLSTPSSQTTTNLDRYGGQTIQRMQQIVFNADGYDNFLLTNNLPYSEVIEFGGYSSTNASAAGSRVTSRGYSKQAPEGVLRTNVARISALIEQQGSRLYGGI